MPGGVDRLGALRGYCNDSGVPLSSDTASTAGSVQNEFGRQLKTFKAAVGNMSESTKQVLPLQTQLLQAVTEHQALMAKGEIEAVLDQVRQHGTVAHEELRTLNRVANTSTELDDISRVVCKNQVAECERMLRRALDEMHIVMDSYHEKCRAQVRRRVAARYDDGFLTGSQIEELTDDVMRSGNDAAVFNQNPRALEELRRVEEDYEGILGIERDMRELHQIFLDMKILVDEQGEQLEVVSTNVQVATQNVEAGRKELAKAKDYSKYQHFGCFKIHKGWFCCGVIVLLAVLIVIIVLLVKK